jgi:hypothetical protein
MVERDPALLPGPTAGQWQGRARLVFAESMAVLLVTLAALGFGWRPHPAVLIVPGAVVLAGFVAWIVLGEIALRRMRIEHDAGYSTTLDVPAVDLRHPRTGVLVRVAGETTPVSPPESMVSRMLRVPRGSILDRPPRD